MDILSVIPRWHRRDRLAIREIARRTGLSRNTIRTYLASDVLDPQYPAPTRPLTFAPRSPRDLLQHACLHYNVISEREEWTLGGTKEDATIVTKGVLCSNNGDVLAEAALQGLRTALLPDFIVA